MQKVLVIVGPTASGKTAFGIRACEKYNGEIISGDSIQIYKGLDIGSAKASLKERKQAIHHLIDIKEPFENYSVKEFQELGRKYINDLTSKGKLPVIVGGTGLYIKALLYDYVFYDEEEKDDQFKELSNQEIYDILMQKDPKCLEKIHVNNRKRLVRALNIVNKHEEGISDIKGRQEHKLLYDALIIGLNKDREKLYDDISKRVDMMVSDGLIDEIKGLLDNGVNFDMQSMQGIGYKEFRDYFNGTKSLEDCILDVKRNTKHFAKRQYTWFNNQMNVNWFDDKQEAFNLIDNWLKI